MTVVYNKINLSVGGIFNVGGFSDFSPKLTQEFEKLFLAFFTHGKIDISNTFIFESESLFSKIDSNQKVVASDDYFNNFTIITQEILGRKQYSLAFDLWSKILLFVKDWEKKNPTKLLHKGTPYYFSAVGSILQMDFDAALMSMHKALEEDKANINQWDSTPGYWFMTLNDQQNTQYFKQFVDYMISFIRLRLDSKKGETYRSKGYGSLTYGDFRKKFLDNKNISEDIKYFFVYSSIRIWRIRRLHKTKHGDTLMAPLIFINALLGLLLVFDELAKDWSNLKGKRKYISDHIAQVAINQGWHNGNIQSYVEDLAVNSNIKNNFEKTILDLLAEKYQTKSGRVLTGLEANLVLVYGLRNFSAHTIKSQTVLWENYTKVLQAVFNSIFKIIELL